MFSTRNPSPGQLSALVALALGLPVGVGVGLLTREWGVAALFFALVWIGNFALIRFIFQRFIYRKIKLIYKLINQTKATRKEEVYYKYVLPPRTLDEVKDDVEAWMQKKNSEIELLLKNETYRKEFLQNLSHEFKTPVFAIQGYVETLLDGALQDETLSRKFLENTGKNAERLVNLVNDLDEIARLESGGQLLYKQNFVIQDQIREVYDALAINIRQKNIQASIKKGSESPMVVFADKERIRQVLINLVANACKYGRTNGSIVASIYPTIDNQALIEIGDDGIGIEAVHLPRVFERFYRTDTARSRNRGGTGLGLAICKHIIEAHGQSIHVRSTPDVGTTIGFTLELKRD